MWGVLVPLWGLPIAVLPLPPSRVQTMYFFMIILVTTGTCPKCGFFQVGAHVMCYCCFASIRFTGPKWGWQIISFSHSWKCESGLWLWMLVVAGGSRLWWSALLIASGVFAMCRCCSKDVAFSWHGLIWPDAFLLYQNLVLVEGAWWICHKLYMYTRSKLGRAPFRWLKLPLINTWAPMSLVLGRSGPGSSWVRDGDFLPSVTHVSFVHWPLSFHLDQHGLPSAYQIHAPYVGFCFKRVTNLWLDVLFSMIEMGTHENKHFWSYLVGGPWVCYFSLCCWQMDVRCVSLY